MGGGGGGGGGEGRGGGGGWGGVGGGVRRGGRRGDKWGAPPAISHCSHILYLTTAGAFRPMLLSLLIRVQELIVTGNLLQRLDKNRTVSNIIM